MPGGGSHFVSQDGTTHYQRNKEAYVARAKDRRRMNMSFIQEFKSNAGCSDCGITDHRVLEFDHLPGKGKTAGVGEAALRGWSQERLLREIERCEVVCSNCHRIRTWERRQSEASGGTEDTPG